MAMNQDIKRYWDAVAGQSEYVDGYLLLGLKMLLKVCIDRRMFCKMTRWDPETAAANIAAQRQLRLQREAAAREKDRRGQFRDAVKVLPQWPHKYLNPEKRKAFMQEYYRQYRKTAKNQAYQREYQRKRRARIKKEKEEQG